MNYKQKIGVVLIIIGAIGFILNMFLPWLTVILGPILIAIGLGIYLAKDPS